MIAEDAPMMLFGLRRQLARLALIGLVALVAGAAGGTARAADPHSAPPARPVSEQHGASAARNVSPSLEDLLRAQDPSAAWLTLALTGAGTLAVFVLRTRLRQD